MKKIMKIKIYSKDFLSFKYKSIFDKKYEKFLKSQKGLQALRDVIIAYRLKKRSGNACTKTRSEVKGTNKKPYKQKGTGMARMGSRKSPICVKGGVVFGPKPKKYIFKINKKIKQLAFKRGLLNKIFFGEIDLIEDFINLKKPKTNLLFKKLSLIYKVKKDSILIINSHFSRDFLISSKNIKNLKLKKSNYVNIWDIVFYKRILIQKLQFPFFLKKIDAS
jgi:large subunit ribosomal protein L4